jgi:cell division protein FtsN
VLAHPETLADSRTLAGAAGDFWFGVRWNGFRPRAAGLDQPVQFRTSAPRDTSDRPDSVRAAADSGSVPPAIARSDSLPSTAMFTVAFASVQNEKQARDVASRIRIDGKSPRITTSDRNGTTLYRVVMGPYESRADAERAGRASGQSYWIIEGVP